MRFLRATPKALTPRSPEGPPIDISVSQGGRVIDGYVDMSVPPAEVLDAIRDNLEITGQFSLSWEASEHPR